MASHIHIPAGSIAAPPTGNIDVHALPRTQPPAAKRVYRKDPFTAIQCGRLHSLPGGSQVFRRDLHGHFIGLQLDDAPITRRTFLSLFFFFCVGENTREGCDSYKSRPPHLAAHCARQRPGREGLLAGQGGGRTPEQTRRIPPRPLRALVAHLGAPRPGYTTCAAATGRTFIHERRRVSRLLPIPTSIYQFKNIRTSERT